MLSAIAKWILESGMLIILVGLGSIFVTSMVKPFIKKGITAYQNKMIQKYNEKNGSGGEAIYTEKWFAEVTTVYCTLCVAIVTLACIIFWYCRYLRIYDFYANGNFYLEVLSAISFAKVVYAAYEGVGGVSLKEVVKKVWKHLSVSFNGSASKVLNTYSNEIIEIIDKVIPLTELGREDLLKAFKNKEETKKEENKTEKN